MLKGYAELGKAAISRGEARAYRLWILARSLDPEGSGWIHLDDLRTEYQAMTGHTSRAFALVLREGSRRWWQIGSERIWLSGLLRISLSLGTRPGRPFQIPDRLFGQIGSFKAASYGGWISSRPEGMTIARSTSCRLWGVTSKTLISWESKAGILTRANIARIPKEPDLEMAGAIEDRPIWRQMINGQQMTFWRIPNTYRGAFVLLPKGRTRSISRILRMSGAVENADGESLYFRDERTRSRIERRQGRFHRTTYSFDGRLGNTGSWIAHPGASFFWASV